MDEEASFRILFATSNFEARAQAAIIDFCCYMLIKLAHLPEEELNTRILNLQKALTNLNTVNHRVRLNVTKVTLLHEISGHFLDQIQCSAPLMHQASRHSLPIISNK